MKFEESIVRALSFCEPRVAKGVAIDLIRRNYDAGVLAGLAKQSRVEQKLGYLADVAARSAEMNNLHEQSARLLSLAGELYDHPSVWCYLIPSLPEWGKEFVAEKSTSELNRKWKVYSSLTPEELSDWVDLYITEEYAAIRKR